MLGRELTDAELALVQRYRLLRRVADEARRALSGAEREELARLERRLGVAPPSRSLPLLDGARRAA